jgi:hypothetical protein
MAPTSLGDRGVETRSYGLVSYSAEVEGSSEQIDRQCTKLAALLIALRKGGL